MGIHADILGLMAGFFVILAFHSHQQKPLRAFAIGSNLLFIAYGVLAGVMPILVLHAILLPLNFVRIYQLSDGYHKSGSSLINPGEWSVYWRNLLGIMLVCVAAILWSTVGVASQMMDATIDPALVGLARTVAGCLFILMFMLRTNRSVIQELENGILPLLAFGVFCAMFQICLFSAFESVGVTITVAVTVCLPPIFVQLLDAFWYRTPLGRNLFLAMAVAILGVVLVLAQSNESFSNFPSKNIYGGAMLLIASISFAGLAISARFIGTGTNAILGTGFGLGVCAVVLMVACMALPKESLEAVYNISWNDVAVLTYIGVFATGLAYLCFVFGLSLSRSAGVGMAATLIEPVAAAVLAAVFLAERLTTIQLIGCVTMLFAIVLLLKSEKGQAQNTKSFQFHSVRA